MISPPTDSLYKFIAIAGTVMVLWGAAFPWNKAHEYELQLVELRAQIDSVGQQAALLQMKYDSLVEQRKALDPQAADFDQEKQAIINKKLQLHIQLIEAQNPVDLHSGRLEVLEKAQRTYEKIGWASVSLGALLMVFGFVAWYLKIQRYLDRDVAKNVIDAS